MGEGVGPVTAGLFHLSCCQVGYDVIAAGAAELDPQRCMRDYYDNTAKWTHHAACSSADAKKYAFAGNITYENHFGPIQRYYPYISNACATSQEPAGCSALAQDSSSCC